MKREFGNRGVSFQLAGAHFGKLEAYPTAFAERKSTISIAAGLSQHTTTSHVRPAVRPAGKKTGSAGG
jgi:hypothetical protein